MATVVPDCLRCFDKLPLGMWPAQTRRQLYMAPAIPFQHMLRAGSEAGTYEHCMSISLAQTFEARSISLRQNQVTCRLQSDEGKRDCRPTQVCPFLTKLRPEACLLFIGAYDHWTCSNSRMAKDFGLCQEQGLHSWSK